MKKVTFILLLISEISFGQVPDPIPNTYVNDLSGKLTTEQLHNLNESILAIEKKSSVQIAIILLDKLPDNLTIEDYALQVGRKWHVGNAANGLVYVAAISQRKQRLEVARNLEHQITDLAALQLTDNIKPYFRSQDYYGGINALLNGIDEKLTPILKEQTALGEAELKKKEDQDVTGWGWVIFWFAIGASLTWIVFIYRRNKAKQIQKSYDDLIKANQPSKGYDYGSGVIAAGVGGITAASAAYLLSKNKERRSSYTPPIIDTDDDTYKRSTYTPPSTSYSSPSSNNDSSYGNWGSGSSDSGSSSSSDSGYSGGGSSNDW